MIPSSLIIIFNEALVFKYDGDGWAIFTIERFQGEYKLINLLKFIQGYKWNLKMKLDYNWNLKISCASGFSKSFNDHIIINFLWHTKQNTNGTPYVLLYSTLTSFPMGLFFHFRIWVTNNSDLTHRYGRNWFPGNSSNVKPFCFGYDW